MGLSCQKTQVTGWGPLSCREQTAQGTWKEAGCWCAVTAQGGGWGEGTHHKGLWARLPHPGLCYQAQGRNRSPVFRPVEQTPVLSWCLHFSHGSVATGSLSGLQGDGHTIL